MIEKSVSLLPSVPRGERHQALVIGFEEAGIEELESLLVTLGVDVIHREKVVVRKVTPATYIGSGKLEELKAKCEGNSNLVVFFDTDLAPKQLRNIEKALTRPVLDRSGVILEIFSRHAKTKEAKTQVELARIEYLLPRLAHFWTHFERQRGGIGLKGMGEKQIEVDRRLLKKRIQILKERLVSIEKERNVQRSGRKQVLKVALVGYTNAGKSTLLNALTESQVLAENKLFATLDSSVKALDPNSHPPIVAIDTVGFISKIPPSLVASFRSTLEEVRQADLLVHIVDGSSREARNQYQVTEEILNDLDLKDKPRIVVVNKIDQLKPSERNMARVISPGAIQISALNQEDVVRLRESILEHFRKKLSLWEVVVPYSQSKVESMIRAMGSVEKISYLEQGTFYRVRMDDAVARSIGLDQFKLG